MQKFNLPVHEHPLYHVGGNNNLGTGLWFECDGCYREAHLDSGYRCSQCPELYLHKKCGESAPEINHPSHPDHPLQLLVGSECRWKRCHLCGVRFVSFFYHCFICDFTLDSGCAINPPLPIIEQPKAHEHTLTLTSSTDTGATGFTCHVCGEISKSMQYLYSCSVCDLFFHIECAFLSPEINHSSHPRHLLKLIKGGSSKNHSNCCTLCGREVEPHQNCYHCPICNFTVDVRCAKNPPPLALVSPKTHKHQLTCLPRRDHFTCNACGKQGNQSPYLCIQCNFMIHRSCIDLPRVIWINRHDHRISLTYDLDEIGNLDLECGVCHQRIDPSYGAYSCLECTSFFVHSKCAAGFNIWDGRDLEGEPEEITIEPFKVIGDNLIKHFSHEEHDMEFTEDGSVEGETITCRACTKSIGAERFYKCKQCDYLLHDACANLPCKKRSMLFPKKLILVGGASYFHEAFRCLTCGRCSSGFRYKSDNFIVDLQCIMKEDIIQRKAHPHTLYFFTAESSNVCSSCNEEATFGFKCLKDGCTFSLDFRCAIFPEEVMHKSDDHPLRLTYQEYGNGKYWCDICDKEVDSKKQYYTCDDCGTTFHITCVLGDLFGSISPGSIMTMKIEDNYKTEKCDIDIIPDVESIIIQYRENRRSCEFWVCEFQVVPNNGINRPTCCVCRSRCTFSLLLKTHDGTDKYFCSKVCLDDVVGTRASLGRLHIPTFEVVAKLFRLRF